MVRPETVQATGLTTMEHTGVLVVTLNRPPANALNRALIRELATLFADLTGQADAPPIVVTGSGDRFFTAGGDIKELAGAAQSELDARMREFHALLVAMERYPRPVICAVNGYCVGGGMEIALFADSVLAVKNAQFGFPEINHGLLPADKGIQRAVKLLGTRTTRRLLLSGTLIDAHRALEAGIVSALIDAPAELVEAAVTSAREAGAKAPVLYAALKRSIYAPADGVDEASLQHTAQAAAAYFADPIARALRETWKDNRARPDHAKHR